MSIILKKINQARQLIKGEEWRESITNSLRLKSVRGVLCGYDKRLTPGFDDVHSVKWRDASLRFEYVKGSLENRLALISGERVFSTNQIFNCVVESSTSKALARSLNHFLDILERETLEFENFKETMGKEFFRQIGFSEFDFQCGTTHIQLGRVNHSYSNEWEVIRRTGIHHGRNSALSDGLGIKDVFNRALKGMNLNDFLLLPQELRDGITNECFQGKID